MSTEFDDLTVGHLRKMLADPAIPDEMLVGVVGHYGELYPFSSLPEVVKARRRRTQDWKQQEPFLVFEHIDIGPEPD